MLERLQWVLVALLGLFTVASGILTAVFLPNLTQLGITLVMVVVVLIVVFGFVSDARRVTRESADQRRAREWRNISAGCGMVLGAVVGFVLALVLPIQGVAGDVPGHFIVFLGGGGGLIQGSRGRLRRMKK